MAKTVLITGCSTGIGRAAARYFQQAGWNVAATMRSPQKETELQKLASVAVLPLDVIDAESIRRAVADTIARFGSIDVLVNNAGYGLFGLFEEETDADIRNQLETNLFGVINTIRAVLPQMRKQRSGVVINVTSLAAALGVPMNSFYCTTKFALEGLTESLAGELAPFGVHFKIVRPGLTKTAFHGKWDYRRLHFADYDGYREAMIEKLNPETSGAPSATSEDVAKVIYTAATDGARTLRYAGGEDARMVGQLRRDLDDDQFFAAMSQQFSVPYKPGPYKP